MDKNLIVSIEGDEIQFQFVPLKQIPYQIILQNPLEDSKIAFKVKTTNPRNYQVKPNQGIINPKETRQIDIILLPTSNTNFTSDKFQILSARVPNNINHLTNQEVEQQFDWKNSQFQEIRRLKVSVNDYNGNLNDQQFNQSTNFGFQSTYQLEQSQKTIEQNSQIQSELFQSLIPQQQIKPSLSSASQQPQQQPVQLQQTPIKQQNQTTNQSLQTEKADYKNKFLDMQQRNEELQKQINKLNEERNKYKQELSSMQIRLQSEKTDQADKSGGLKFIQLIIFAILGIILGAYLTSN